MSNSEWNTSGAGAQAQGGQDTGRAPYAAVGQQRPTRSPALATIMSVMPGLGHIYVGYYQQGFINMGIVAGCITLLSSHGMHGLKPFVALGMAFFWMFNMIDANRRAMHYNRVSAGLGAEELPDDFKLPKSGGSLFGGIVLVLIGVLFVLDLNFDISLDWLENWWPLALVLVGGRLIWQARRKGR